VSIKGLISFIIGLTAAVNLNAAGEILNNVQHQESQSHFKVVYEFSNPVDEKDVKIEFINSTVQVNVKGAELDQDKRFDKVSDPLVKNLYTFKPDRDTLALRINYEKKFDVDKFKGRVETKIEGNQLIVSVADGRAVLLGTLDNILEEPSNLNNQKIEDKYKYLQLKLTEDEAIAQEKAPSAKAPAVISAENFENKMQTQLKYDASDSIAEDIPVVHQAPIRKKEGPIKVRSIRGISSDDKVLLEEDVSLEEQDFKGKKESEIPVFGTKVKKSEKKNESPMGGLMSGLLIIAGLLFGGFLFLRQYANKKRKEQKHHTIKVLTQHHLGPKKSLMILRVAGESMLVGVTDHNINLIKPLSLLDEEIEEMEEDASFDKRLSSANINEEIGMGMDFEEEEEEEFNIRGIKDLVKNRLSGMKEL